MEIKRRAVLWVLIGILFIVALFLVFQAGASGAVQTTSAAGNAAQTAASAMVGGC